EAFMRFMNRGGIVKGETIASFTRRQSELSTRALGWDTRSAEGSSAGSVLGPRSFGHTGYTGTSVWCDPDSGNWAILLTNRVHPTAENTKIIEFRPKFHDAAFG
ncbi:MAG TPA: serine hydrolase, partial [Fimbriimonas sp.]